jgi:LmbE family N-acetylglucosaminyl deacetylase
LEPHTVPEVWLMGGPEPDHTVDITETVDRKIAALRCHRSQLPDPEGMAERIRGWTQATAEQAGLAPGRAAESFRKVPTV